MIPSVEFQKVDGGTGVVRPSAVGVLAIIAAAQSGTNNSAGSFARRDELKATHGWGHLTEFGAYVQALSRKPIVAVKSAASTAGDYSALVITNEGTSVITEGASAPLDEFDVVIQFTAGGTVGSAGAKYKYSLNGGKEFSKELALGTANTIAIPDTGVGVALAAGTILATTKVAFTTLGPKVTNADLPAALEALRVTSSPFDAVLVDMEADATTVSTCDLWLKSLSTGGRFKTVVLTARPRNAGETEAQYKDALATIFDAAASTDVLVCADGGDLDSLLRGISQPRPTGLGVAARGMSIRVGEDPAYVGRGPLPGYRITDSRNNPKWHDEAKFPGLDDLRLTALRTIEGFNGVFINNARLLSPTNSDFVYWQHARTLNRGCEIAYQVLTKELSRGVEKNPEPGPNGERYIAEADARRFEGLVNAELERELVKPGEVDDMALLISRTDDIRSNAGAEITVELQSVSLAYVKKFKVSAGFVTAIETEQ